MYVFLASILANSCTILLYIIDTLYLFGKRFANGNLFLLQTHTYRKIQTTRSLAKRSFNSDTKEWTIHNRSRRKCSILKKQTTTKQKKKKRGKLRLLLLSQQQVLKRIYKNYLFYFKKKRKTKLCMLLFKMLK